LEKGGTVIGEMMSSARTRPNALAKSMVSVSETGRTDANSFALASSKESSAITFYEFSLIVTF
jgi:hypothetical protein